MDEMSGGSMDEIKLLAGIFQNILQNGKNLQPLVSEFITQTGKLETQLRATSKTLSAVLESFNVIAARASNSNSSSPDIGHCLTQVYIHNKAMESYLTAITNGLCNGVNGLLRSRSEEMKRSLGNLEKQHSREFKKLHHNIKRKMELVNKLQKKLKKENAAGSNKEEVDKLSEVLTQTRKSLAAEYRVLEEQERQAVRRVSINERIYLSFLLSSIKPVLVEDIHILQEVEGLRDIVTTIDRISSNPEHLPSHTDQYIQDLKLSDLRFSFRTPPASPRDSFIGSRCGSLRSLSSFSSSRPSSPPLPSSHPQPSRDILDTASIYSNNGDCKRFSTISCNSLQSQESCKISPESVSSYSETLSPLPRGRPSSVSRSSKGYSVNSSPSRTPIQVPASPSLSRASNTAFSTVKRAHSPFTLRTLNNECRERANVYSPQGSPIKTNTGEQISQENLNLNQDLEKTRNGTVTRRPPLPRKYLPNPPQRTCSLERKKNGGREEKIKQNEKEVEDGRINDQAKTERRSSSFSTDGFDTHIPFKPGDFPSIPGDIPSIPGDISCKPADIPSIPGGISFKPGDFPSLPRDFNSSKEEYNSSGIYSNGLVSSNGIQVNHTNGYNGFNGITNGTNGYSGHYSSKLNGNSSSLTYDSSDYANNINSDNSVGFRASNIYANSSQQQHQQQHQGTNCNSAIHDRDSHSNPKKLNSFNSPKHSYTPSSSHHPSSIPSHPFPHPSHPSSHSPIQQSFSSLQSSPFKQTSNEIPRGPQLIQPIYSQNQPIYSQNQPKPLSNQSNQSINYSKPTFNSPSHAFSSSSAGGGRGSSTAIIHPFSSPYSLPRSLNINFNKDLVKDTGDEHLPLDINLDINQNKSSSHDSNTDDLATPVVENSKQGELWGPGPPKQRDEWGPGTPSKGLSDDDITPTVEQIPYMNLQGSNHYAGVFSQGNYANGETRIPGETGEIDLKPSLDLTGPRIQDPYKTFQDETFDVNQTNDVTCHKVKKSEFLNQNKLGASGDGSRVGRDMNQQIERQDGSGRIDDIWTRIILPERRGRVQRQLSDPGSQIYKYLNPGLHSRHIPRELQDEIKSEPSPGTPGALQGFKEPVSTGEERNKRIFLKRSQSLGVSESVQTLEPRHHRRSVVSPDRAALVTALCRRMKQRMETLETSSLYWSLYQR